MKSCRVSVIVPVYNASRYVIDTLESVRNQSYRDWEVIVVDDGSTDSSAERVEEYLSEHPGMGKLLFHPGRVNRGTSASRNLGTSRAKGELLCFLDADDIWDVDFLEHHVALFENLPGLAISYGPAALWYSEEEGRQQILQNLGIEADRVVDPHLLFELFLTGEADTPSPSGVMISREGLSLVGGWEENFQGMYDDQVLYSKLLLNHLRVYVTSNCLYRYRQHNDSLCHKAEKDRCSFKSREKYLEWLKQYLARSGKAPEQTKVIMAEQSWYVKRQYEIQSGSPGAWWREKLSGLFSLIRHVAGAKDKAFAFKVLARILFRQFLHVAHRPTAS